ncbi:uncharacterized protein [Diadema setosum]|uniref:uncharacterized protein n=1 Tax=Diadema setosum TaxID=31175 RepID=UPI003B3A0513
MARNSAELTAALSLAGSGVGIVYMSGLLELRRLPEERYGLYLGLGSAGFPAGMFVVPLIGDLLMQTYGWRGAMLIVGGLTAYVIPLSMLNQPQIGGASCSTTNREHSNGDYGIEEDEIAGQSSPNISTHCCGPASIDTTNSDDQMSTRGDTKQTTEISMDGLSDERTELLREEPDSSSQGNIPRRLERWAQTVKESDFCTSLDLVLFMIFSTFHTITYSGWHTFLIPRAVERGMPVLLAITLSFSAGLANVVGRIGIGVFKDRFGRAMDTILFLTFLLALSLLCDVFVNNFAVTFIMSCIEAFSLASRAVLAISVVKEIAPRSYETALALQVLILGLGSMLGSYLGGEVR